MRHRATLSSPAPRLRCRSPASFRFLFTTRRTSPARSSRVSPIPFWETQDAWVVHGFSFANYLEELGATAQQDIYEQSSVDKAMRDAFRKMRHFLMTAKGLSEDEAISLMSVAVDFGITQVVDGNWGVQGTLKEGSVPGRRRIGSPAVRLPRARAAHSSSPRSTSARTVWPVISRMISPSTIRWNRMSMPSSVRMRS